MISNNMSAVAIVAGTRRCGLRNDADRWRLAEAAGTPSHRPPRFPGRTRHSNRVVTLRPCVPELLS